MGKDFCVSQAERDGRFDISIWKKGTSASGTGTTWFVQNVPPDKQAEAYAQILDMVGVANAQPDFNRAKEVIDEKFRLLCEKLGFP